MKIHLFIFFIISITVQTLHACPTCVGCHGNNNSHAFFSDEFYQPEAQEATKITEKSHDSDDGE